MDPYARTPERETAGTARAVDGPSPEWPPPGLESVWARAPRTARRFALGGLLLALPVLWLASGSPGPWALGPYRGAWWAPALVAAAGAAILARAWWRLFRLLRAAAAAVDGGRDWLTLARVAADYGGDTGLIVRGARQYAALSPRLRRDALHARVAAAGLGLAAAVAVPVGFGIALPLAGAGALGEAGMWLMTFGPAALLAFGALLARALDGTVARRARRLSRADRAPNAEPSPSAAGWYRALDAAGDADLSPSGGRGRGLAGALRAAAVAAMAGVLLLGPAIAFTATSTAGGRLLSRPLRLGTFSARVAGLETLRGYGLEPDTAVTPAAAGAALHAIARVGRAGDGDRHGRDPVRRYDEPWPEPPEGVQAATPLGGLAAHVEAAAAGRLSADLRTHLAALAAHPAGAELERLARAPAADIAGQRWVLPLPDSVPATALPIGRTGGVRQAGAAHVARGIVELAGGRADRAERAFREVVSAGFLLLDEGVALRDNLVGRYLVEMGVSALEPFYRVTGRTRAAEAVAADRRHAERVRARAAVERIGASPESFLRAAAGIVTDSSAARGMRWEFLGLLNTIAPCVNPHRLLFGPGPEAGEWRERARRSLVRYEAEGELFRALRHGRYTAADERPSLAIVDLLLPGSGTAGTCAALATRLN